MSDTTSASGTAPQQSSPTPRVATTSELRSAAEQLGQMVAAHLGTSGSPAPAPGQH